MLLFFCVFFSKQPHHPALPSTGTAQLRSNTCTYPPLTRLPPFTQTKKDAQAKRLARMSEKKDSLNHAIKPSSTGTGSFPLTTMTTKPTCTTSNLPFNSAGISSFFVISRVLSSRFWGSHPAGGNWAGEMSKPVNLTFAWMRDLARDMSQILREREPEGRTRTKTGNGWMEGRSQTLFHSQRRRFR